MNILATWERVEVRPPRCARVVNIGVRYVFSFKPLRTAIPNQNFLPGGDVFRGLESVLCVLISVVYAYMYTCCACNKTARAVHPGAAPGVRAVNSVRELFYASTRANFLEIISNSLPTSPPIAQNPFSSLTQRLHPLSLGLQLTYTTGVHAFAAPSKHMVLGRV